MSDSLGLHEQLAGIQESRVQTLVTLSYHFVGDATIITVVCYIPCKLVSLMQWSEESE